MQLVGLANKAAMTSLQLTVLCGAASAGSCMAATFRNKDDNLNFGAGGALAGALLGLRSGRPHEVVLKVLLLLLLLLLSL